MLGVARRWSNLTLRRMADGGIHDQIGGGFCRYCVDERWEIPHFEKMLYDNAQLLPLYALRRDRSRFAAAANGIVAWLRREMTAPARRLLQRARRRLRARGRQVLRLAARAKCARC